MSKKESIRDYDAIVVGAGFAGMYALYCLRNMGMRVKVYEQASSVGGTWYWNRYPGARCDVDSMQYSYAFSSDLQQEWDWTEKYATQPEILKYAEHVAKRFDLKKDIDFNTSVKSIVFDEKLTNWEIKLDTGKIIKCSFVIMATGNLSVFNKVPFKGVNEYSGRILYTGQWPHHDIDISCENVGIVGTGSSAIQSIPIIAKEAKHLYVFQRTPHYSVPAYNQKLQRSPNGKAPVGFKQAKGFDCTATVDEIKADYQGLRDRARSMFTAMAFQFNKQSALEVSDKKREKIFESYWQRGGIPFLAAFNDLSLSLESNYMASEFVRKKIQNVVKDPKIAELLTPKYNIGCKRLAVDTGYYESFNRSNVTLVDISKDPIKRLNPEGIELKEKNFNLDTIIMATGFDAMTGALSNINIKGKRGADLKDKWIHGPRSYLGIAISGFPNFFMVTGPNSPSVLANLIVGIEHHVNWICKCIKFMEEKKYNQFDVITKEEDNWISHSNELVKNHIYSTCDSWYVGANVPGKSRIFMPYVGGFPKYAEKCKEIEQSDYKGFIFT